jgi:hypothetical protein
MIAEPGLSNIELLEQELSQKCNSRLSRLQEIKEKVDVVQACKYYFY